MKKVETGFEGLVVIEPEVYEDDRGDFFETYNTEKLGERVASSFPLEFQSLSKKGVIRGLHFQKAPHAQGKLVRVSSGKAFDVVVDLRADSATYRKWFSVVLSAENKKQLWIPPGFAHGFLALEDDTIMFYKLTHGYHKESEEGITWDDPDLAISWPLSSLGIAQPLLSEKDSQHPQLNSLNYQF